MPMQKDGANAMLPRVPLLRSSTAIDSSKQHQILTEPPVDGLKTGKRSGTLWFQLRNKLDIVINICYLYVKKNKYIYIHIFVHMYLWHHMCMLWLLCPKTLDSLLPLGVATWRAGGGYKYIARLEHFYNLLTKCCNLPYKWC